MRDLNLDVITRFTALRVDNYAEKGRAPHKPLIPLAVLDLLEAGRLTDVWVMLSLDLILRFQNLWPIVAERRTNKGDIRMHFHALSTDGIWSVFDEDGRPSRARWLGFTRTGTAIHATARSLTDGLLCEGRLESKSAQTRRT